MGVLCDVPTNYLSPIVHSSTLASISTKSFGTINSKHSEKQHQDCPFPPPPPHLILIELVVFIYLYVDNKLKKIVVRIWLQIDRYDIQVIEVTTATYRSNHSYIPYHLSKPHCSSVVTERSPKKGSPTSEVLFHQRKCIAFHMLPHQRDVKLTQLTKLTGKKLSAI